jgi:DNA-directed RNA polymerase specialized sigma24 family protein
VKLSELQARMRQQHKRRNPNTRLTLEQESQVRLNYAAGQPVVQIAAAFGISTDTVYGIVRRGRATPHA